MLAKLVFSICLLLNLFSFSWEDGDERFDVVSTRQKRFNSSNVEQTIIKLIDGLKEEIGELKTLVKSIESQNAATTLKFEQALTKLKENGEEMSNRLKSLEKKAQKTEEEEAKYPKNCEEVKQRGRRATSINLIQPDLAPQPFRVLCNTKKREGGWTYILKRTDGSQNFNLSWSDYKLGFGNLSNEFWLGLDNIYYLTGQEANELLVELVDWNNTEVYAHYLSFSIGNESEGYYLKVLKDYNGTAEDSLGNHINMKFSTPDKDQDIHPIGNCASEYGGGWWFEACESCHLTGRYFDATKNNTDLQGKGIHWYFFGYQYGLKEIRMLVRPRED